jgi:hypothetical protein
MAKTTFHTPEHVCIASLLCGRFLPPRPMRTMRLLGFK